jgi:hypothetical protein
MLTHQTSIPDVSSIEYMLTRLVVINKTIMLSLFGRCHLCQIGRNFYN